MTSRWLLSFCFILGTTICSSQPGLHYFRITSANTSFPDTGRMKGHLYNRVLYTAADHYADSSVLIIVPEKFRAMKKVDLIFWFHGWGNNIDSSLVRYGLSRQFAGAGVNAVLVLAETAKDAPDSYGGKLEQNGVFASLTGDVLQKLTTEKVIAPGCRPGHIILAGHSGAYRVMAHILQSGGLPVSEVILFDALYGETNIFLDWITAGKEHRFIDLYTDHGGTFDETKNMMNRIKDLKIREDSLEETAVTPRLLQKNRLVFIHTPHAHNDIIQRPDNFSLFITSNPFLKKAR